MREDPLAQKGQEGVRPFILQNKMALPKFIVEFLSQFFFIFECEGSQGRSRHAARKQPEQEKKQNPFGGRMICMQHQWIALNLSLKLFYCHNGILPFFRDAINIHIYGSFSSS